MELCIMIQMLQNVLIKVFFEELTHLTKSVQQKRTDIICVYRHGGLLYFYRTVINWNRNRYINSVQGRSL